MQGDIVAAARWLGASILLASGIFVVGARPTQTKDGDRGDGPVATLSSPGLVGQPGPIDTAVIRGEAESSSNANPTSRSRLEVCYEIEGSQRIPILDANPSGSAPANCLDPPSEAEVWEKVPKSKAGAATLHETQRDNVRIAVEKIGEKVDPCKVYPLAGPCELVHCHYKCSVSFDESRRTDSPVPLNHVDHRVEVVYLDKDHLRRCSGPEKPATAP